METYSVWADLLQTFRMMSDGVKVLLIYMPCVFMLGFTALYLHHLRQRIRTTRKEPQPYAILPPDKTLPQEPVHPSVKTLHRLDAYIANVEQVTRK